MWPVIATTVNSGTPRVVLQAAVQFMPADWHMRQREALSRRRLDCVLSAAARNDLAS